MISHFIKSLKKEGWRQQDIAEKIGVTREYISNLSRGSNCSLETAIKLADAFNVSLDTVIGRKQPEQPISATQELLLAATTDNDELARVALRSIEGEKLIKAREKTAGRVRAA